MRWIRLSEAEYSFIFIVSDVYFNKYHYSTQTSKKKEVWESELFANYVKYFWFAFVICFFRKLFNAKVILDSSVTI